MRKFLDPSEFTPTKWNTAADKAEFGNQLLEFILSGFKAGRFTEKLYIRLSMCFGFIAHYDRNSFAETWFDDTESCAAFVNQILKSPCFGDPAYTYSDVEKAIQREVTRLNLAAALNETAAAATRQREIALLESLERTYRGGGKVVEMPRPESTTYDGPAEQLPLIA